MLQPKNVMTVGFDVELFPPQEGFIWLVHDDEVPEELSANEWYLMCQKMVEQSDVLLVNTSGRKVSFDEAVLVHTAYTKSTPILVVGKLPKNNLLNAMYTKRFDTLDEAKQHLTNFYID